MSTDAGQPAEGAAVDAVPSSDALADIDPLDEGERPEEEAVAEMEDVPETAVAIEDEAVRAGEDVTPDELALPDEPAEPDRPVEPGEAAPPTRRQLSRGERETYERQRQRFAACGRCGYFVADCLVYAGPEALEAAILTAKEGWVQLQGDRAFARLVMYAYGYQLDYEFDYFDGACPECRRRVVLDGRVAGETTLKIQT